MKKLKIVVAASLSNCFWFSPAGLATASKGPSNVGCPRAGAAREGGPSPDSVAGQARRIIATARIIPFSLEPGVLIVKFSCRPERMASIVTRARARALSLLLMVLHAQLYSARSMLSHPFAAF